MRHIRRSLIEDAIADLEVRLFAEYSGRFMYGEKCLGLTGQDNEIAKAIFNLGLNAKSDEADDLVDMLGTERRDSMGKDAIVYYPGWQLDIPDTNDHQA